jgi:hypothetical protein
MYHYSRTVAPKPCAARDLQRDPVAVVVAHAEHGIRRKLNEPTKPGRTRFCARKHGSQRSCRISHTRRVESRLAVARAEVAISSIVVVALLSRVEVPVAACSEPGVRNPDLLIRQICFAGHAACGGDQCCERK